MPSLLTTGDTPLPSPCLSPNAAPPHPQESPLLLCGGSSAVKCNTGSNNGGAKSITRSYMSSFLSSASTRSTSISTPSTSPSLFSPLYIPPYSPSSSSSSPSYSPNTLLRAKDTFPASCPPKAPTSTFDADEGAQLDACEEKLERILFEAPVLDSSASSPSNCRSVQQESRTT